MEASEEKKAEGKASSSKRLPDPIGSSSEEEVSERSSSHAKSAERSPTRSPLVRRPHGAKQRKKFARGEYGDRVRFKEPVATVVEDRRRPDTPPKGKWKAQGKGPGRRQEGLEEEKEQERKGGLGCWRASQPWREVIPNYGEGPAHLLSYIHH